MAYRVKPVVVEAMREKEIGISMKKKLGVVAMKSIAKGPWP